MRNVLFCIYEKHFEAYTDGFRGSYYPCREKTDKAFIEMFGDDTDDYLARRALRDRFLIENNLDRPRIYHTKFCFCSLINKKSK